MSQIHDGGAGPPLPVAGLLDALDLNLLRVLDTLLEVRSATIAARRLGLTQSAVSHALSRLREALGDPLLVRARGGLEPTARAENLRAPLRDCLGRLERVLAPETFDPSTATGTFLVGTADYTVFLFGTALYRRLEVEAPRVDMRLVPVPQGPNGALVSGAVHLVIGVWAPDRPIPEGIVLRRLLRDRFVCLLRSGHPARTWDLATYTGLRHIQIAPQGTAGGPLDEVLAGLGVRRRIAVTLPSFLVAPRLVASSDSVLTLPERVARPLAAELGLQVLPLPFDAPDFDLSMGWHARHHAEPAQRWLRGVVESVGEG